MIARDQNLNPDQRTVGELTRLKKVCGFENFVGSDRVDWADGGKPGHGNYIL